MKEFIWKIRYALRINKFAKCGLLHGWYLAGVAIESFPEWVEESPEDMADEEMSSWTDDGE